MCASPTPRGLTVGKASVCKSYTLGPDSRQGQCVYVWGGMGACGGPRRCFIAPLNKAQGHHSVVQCSAVGLLPPPPTHTKSIIHIVHKRSVPPPPQRLPVQKLCPPNS